ncbi:MAG: hypothetical protein KatS3mg130_1059 [Candidatus Sumerlaea sp.]|nr:MAG: hypothetical protein KatS3mg130_1059 [Candidatus Sumerlaea sp.]
MFSAIAEILLRPPIQTRISIWRYAHDHVKELDMNQPYNLGQGRKSLHLGSGLVSRSRK